MDQSTVKKSFNRIGWSFVAFTLITLICSLVISVIAGIAVPDLIEKSWFDLALSGISMWAVAFPIFLLIIKKVPDNPPVQTENRKISVGKMLLLCLAVIGLSQVIAILFDLLGSLVSSWIGIEIANAVSNAIIDASLWVSLVSVLVIAPILEEIVFRRILYKKIAGYSGKLYMVISALFFALFHQNLYQFPFCFVTGLIFAYVTYRTGKTIYAMILHFAMNAVSGVLLILLSAGDESAIAIYSTAVLFVSVIGFIFAIVWYLIRRKTLHFEHDKLAERPRNKTVYGAFGMWFYIAILAIMSVINVLLLAFI